MLTDEASFLGMQGGSPVAGYPRSGSRGRKLARPCASRQPPAASPKHRVPCCALLSCLLAAGTARAGQVKLGIHTFTLEDGFEIELAAGPPLADRPIGADFDELGRLYVTDSAGVNTKPEEQLKTLPHRVVRLEDTDGDGRFDKSTVFADKLMFPEGVLWFDGALYVGAPPSIWKLEDTDGDGVADRRSEWFTGKTLTGCANDLHGPYLGRDGRLYWAKGAFAKQNIERPGKPPITDSAAHIYSARPDGSDIDSLMAGGMDNPVEVVFTPAGEAIFTTTFFHHPEAGRRDALVHAVYGGVYPKPHGVLDGLKRTGELLPPITDLGPAVPSGLAYVESPWLRANFRGDLFSTQFNYRKVQRHILEPDGSTFRTRDLDFLASDNTDFHPTDVLEDADGSLLVLDTGGWYKLCCPSSQIAKPEVLGAIYRIRPQGGGPRVEDPRGTKLRWKAIEPGALAALLDDKRPAVRTRAIAECAKRGDLVVPALGETIRREPTVERRRNAVWALSRIESPNAREEVRKALADADASVRQAAAHSVGLHRDAGAVPALLEALRMGPPSLRRSAAEALGKIGDRAAVAPILSASSLPADRMLEHSFIYALIEMAAPAETRAGLEAPSPSTRRVVLIALDQMDGGDLRAAEVAALLSSPEKVLRDTAVWIAGHHPEWGADLAGYFRERLEPPGPAESDAAALRDQVLRFAASGAVQELIARRAGETAAPPATRRLLLEVMGLAPLKEAPAAWLETLERCLGDRDEAVVRGAAHALRSLPAPKSLPEGLAAALRRVAGDSRLPAEARLDALSALRDGVGPPGAEVFEFLRGCLDPSRSPVERSTAAAVLARARLDDEQLASLAESLKEAGPLEFPALLAAFSGSESDAVGKKLVEALRESKGLAGLRADTIRPIFAKYPEAARKASEELVALSSAEAAAQGARLEEAAAKLAAGDVTRGRAVFNSTKSACATCHAIGYLGGKLGPDLTRIGGIRTERDLLESILFPSSNFVRSYETIDVVTKAGEVFSGVLRQESADTVLLTRSATEERRFQLGEIQEMRPGSTSIMPQGLDQQLTIEELADMVAFLRSMK